MKLGDFITTGKIIKNKLVFDEKYKPPVIYHREKEIKEIIYFFKTFQECSGNLDIIGSMGTGKTLTILNIMDDFEKLIDQRALKIVYINCKKFYTCTMVIVELARKLSGDMKLSHFKCYEIFRKKLERLVGLIVILDEIDILLQRDKKDKDRLLYILADEPNISIINISNRPNWRNMIEDGRVVSRMPPNPILFRPYNSKELFDILLQRAKEGLHKDTWDDEILEMIANKVAFETGDARRAIRVLLKSAEHAELFDKDAIDVNDVKFALERVKSQDVTFDFIETLTPQKRAILIVLFDLMHNFNIYPTVEEIHKRYNLLVRNSRIFTPLKLNTVKRYITELETYGLIERVYGNVGLGRGKGKEAGRYKLAVEDIDRFKREFYDVLFSSA